MNNVTEKLAKCFALVFPNLKPDQIPSTSAENLSEWDSIAQVNLLSVIGEEFEMDIDFEEFEGATSFASLAERLREISARA